jgi:hypothetical protein
MICKQLVKIEKTLHASMSVPDIVYGADLVNGKARLNALSTTSLTVRTKRLGYQNRVVIESDSENCVVNENHHYTSTFTRDELRGKGEKHPEADTNPMHASQPQTKENEEDNVHYVPLLTVQQVLVQPGVVTEVSITRFWAVIVAPLYLSPGVLYPTTVLIEVYESGELCRVSVLEEILTYQTIAALGKIADIKNLAVM